MLIAVRTLTLITYSRKCLTYTARVEKIFFETTSYHEFYEANKKSWLTYITDRKKFNGNKVVNGRETDTRECNEKKFNQTMIAQNATIKERI